MSPPKRPPHNASPPPPAPTVGGLYCHTCGRLITPRKSHLRSLNTPTPPKYCSDRCRREKPASRHEGVESAIEGMYVRLLGGGGEGDRGEGASMGKGVGRRVVQCSEVEGRVFGGKTHNEKDQPAEDGLSDGFSDGDEDDDDDDHDGGVSLTGYIPLPSTSASAPKIKSQAGLTPQQLGRQRAANREKVRQAARRGVVFGFPFQGHRRRAEAVQNGRVVEASFAKGEWGVRWRDEG